MLFIQSGFCESGLFQTGYFTTDVYNALLIIPAFMIDVPKLTDKRRY